MHIQCIPSNAYTIAEELRTKKETEMENNVAEEIVESQAEEGYTGRERISPFSEGEDVENPSSCE